MRRVAPMLILLIAFSGSAAAQELIFSNGFESGNLSAWSAVMPCVPAAPGCPGECYGNEHCAASEYCDASNACVPDQDDGMACTDAASCQSGHCQNGYCCAFGDCCATAADCGSYDQEPQCESAASCQGSRTDGSCSAQSRCEAILVEDDSACAGLEADDCGFYPPVYCSAAVDQPPPVCPTGCMGDEDCDAAAHCDAGACVADVVQGEACDEPSDCVAGLFCTDSVCCSSACDGVCEACDLAASTGICALVDSGTDPDDECGGESCLGYYAGWSGDSCHGAADLGDAAVSCDGAGGCQSAAELCGSSGPGPVVASCDSQCQTPDLETCTGQVAGSCVDLDLGMQSCGQGVCAVTVPVCLDGAPQSCVPNTDLAEPESCNDVDDDCDGVVDNGSFADSFEPNDACASFFSLPTVGSDQTLTITSATVFPGGDGDFYRIRATESDSTCSCCDAFCSDEDFQLEITLSVPASAGSYVMCTGDSCLTVNDNCVEVVAGQSQGLTWTLDGGCPAIDSYDRYVHVYGQSSPAFECTPYTLSYTFTPGCF